MFGLCDQAQDALILLRAGSFQVTVDVFERSEESFEAGGSAGRGFAEFVEVAVAEELGLGDNSGPHGFVFVGAGGPRFAVD